MNSDPIELRRQETARLAVMDQPESVTHAGEKAATWYRERADIHGKRADAVRAYARVTSLDAEYIDRHDAAAHTLDNAAYIEENPIAAVEADERTEDE